jgi:hypothetical protein
MNMVIRRQSKTGGLALNKRNIKLLIVSLFFLFLSSSLYYATPIEEIKILVVCSDINDVMFANNLATITNSSVDILYLGIDLPDDRSKLSDPTYLIKYDEIWIPDLNVQWTEGGRLTREEVEALSNYVMNGGILVLGLNTYTQSWNRKLEEITGTRIIRIEKPETDSSEWDIIFNGRFYLYNDTYQTVIVSPYRARVLANYSNGLPAITLSHYGSGVGVLITFNPVEELIEHNPEIIDIYAHLAILALSERLGKPKIPIGELVLITLKKVFSHPFFLGALVFIILEIIAYLGFLPFGVTVLLAIPFLPFSKLLLKEECSKILEKVQTLRGVTLENLARELRKPPRRLKLPLVLLFLKKKIVILDLSPMDVRDSLVTPRGSESEGVAQWAIKRYPLLMREIIKNPRIRVIELAYRVDMPPYDVLRLLRELSRYGVVELKKAVVDYEVRPLDPLLRWSEV